MCFDAISSTRPEQRTYVVIIEWTGWFTLIRFIDSHPEIVSRDCLSSLLVEEANSLTRQYRTVEILLVCRHTCGF